MKKKGQVKRLGGFPIVALTAETVRRFLEKPPVEITEYSTVDGSGRVVYSRRVVRHPKVTATG